MHSMGLFVLHWTLSLKGNAVALHVEMEKKKGQACSFQNL